MRTSSPGTITAPTCASASAPEVTLRARLADYKELLKPGIAAFVVAMAAASYLLALDEPLNWTTLLGLVAGTGLTAGGAGALNHVVEYAYDAKMERTAQRPVATGRLGRGAATAYGLTCAVLGVLVLALTTTHLTTGLALLTILLYVAVYTPLKRRTVHNTLVGAVPGALPALGGAAAATGALDPTGWTLFALLYLWQLPHFFALAWMLREDYARGGFRMLPSAPGGARATASLVLIATGLLLAVGLLPAVVSEAGWLYLTGMAGVGAGFLLPAVRFYRAPSIEHARRLLWASIIYVPAFLLLVVADYLLR